MKPSPQICPGCAHVFPPGTPEPSWCPDCGRICSALDPPYESPGPPEEYPLGDDERRRWRVWFWWLTLLGPVLVVLARPLLWAATQWFPAVLRPVLQLSRPVLWIAMPALCAAGAAICLARSQRVRRSRTESVVFVICATAALLIAQAVLLVLALGLAVSLLR